MTQSKIEKILILASIGVLSLAIAMPARADEVIISRTVISNAPVDDTQDYVSDTSSDPDVTATAIEEKTGQNGDITYVTGGVGDDERDAIKAQANNYNLHISAASRAGHYMIDNGVTIASKKGQELVNEPNAGPLFYAKLPPGIYVITATNGDQHQSRTVRISPKKSSDVHFTWQKG